VGRRAPQVDYAGGGGPGRSCGASGGLGDSGVTSPPAGLSWGILGGLEGILRRSVSRAARTPRTASAFRRPLSVHLREYPRRLCISNAPGARPSGPKTPPHGTADFASGVTRCRTHSYGGTQPREPSDLTDWGSTTYGRQAPGDPPDSP
jgi:hypothetical protein